MEPHYMDREGIVQQLNRMKERQDELERRMMAIEKASGMAANDSETCSSRPKTVSGAAR